MITGAVRLTSDPIWPPRQLWLYLCFKAAEHAVQNPRCFCSQSPGGQHGNGRSLVRDGAHSSSPKPADELVQALHRLSGTTSASPRNWRRMDGRARNNLFAAPFDGSPKPSVKFVWTVDGCHSLCNGACLPEVRCSTRALVQSAPMPISTGRQRRRTRARPRTLCRIPRLHVLLNQTLGRSNSSLSARDARPTVP